MKTNWKRSTTLLPTIVDSKLCKKFVLFIITIVIVIYSFKNCQVITMFAEYIHII
jgi:hypothetical protein